MLTGPTTPGTQTHAETTTLVLPRTTYPQQTPYGRQDRVPPPGLLRPSTTTEALKTDTGTIQTGLTIHTDYQGGDLPNSPPRTGGRGHLATDGLHHPTIPTLPPHSPPPDDQTSRRSDEFEPEQMSRRVGEFVWSSARFLPSPFMNSSGRLIRNASRPCPYIGKTSNNVRNP